MVELPAGCRSRGSGQCAAPSQLRRGSARSYEGLSVSGPKGDRQLPWPGSRDRIEALLARCVAPAGAARPQSSHRRVLQGAAAGRTALFGSAQVFRAMENNGSPAPAFRFDEGRTFFQTTLPRPSRVRRAFGLEGRRRASHPGRGRRRASSVGRGLEGSARVGGPDVRTRPRLRRAREHEARPPSPGDVFEAQGTGGALLRVVRRTAGALVGIGKGRQAQRLLERYGSDAFDEAGAAVFSARTVHEPGWPASNSGPAFGAGRQESGRRRQGSGWRGRVGIEPTHPGSSRAHWF